MTTLQDPRMTSLVIDDATGHMISLAFLWQSWRYHRVTYVSDGDRQVVQVIQQKMSTASVESLALAACAQRLCCWTLVKL